MAPMILGYEPFKGTDISLQSMGRSHNTPVSFSSHSTSEHLQLCALFRNQMMFALGGAARVSDPQDGNPKGRVSSTHSGDAVFS